MKRENEDAHKQPNASKGFLADTTDAPKIHSQTKKHVLYIIAGVLIVLIIAFLIYDLKP